MQVFLFSWQKHMFWSLCSNSANSIGRKKSKKKKNMVCICNIVHSSWRSAVLVSRDMSNDCVLCKICEDQGDVCMI